MAFMKLGDMAEGSIIKLNEDGAAVEFYVAKQDYESELNGPGRVLVVRKECYDARAWHSSNVNAYATSDIDTWFNGTYKNLLDADIRAAMGTTKIYYTPGNGNWNVTTLERSVFPLSATELGQTDSSMNAEGTALSSTVLNLLKIAYLSGSTYTQWTRSPYLNYAHSAWCLNGDDSISSYICSNTRGIRPAFTLPSTRYVSDDGSVSVNTAPIAPQNITVPIPINGGSTAVISWGAASDADGNLEGYELERQVDSRAWVTVFTGNALTFTDSITKGWQTVAYRVRAYDAIGAYSGYTTSSSKAVNNNTPPVISCEFPANTLLGVKNADFSVSYSVEDAEGDTVSVTEAIDGTALRTFPAALGEENSFQITGETFMRLLNGTHTLMVTASDGEASAMHSLTFTKLVTHASVSLKQPMEADGPITVCVLSVSGHIPEDAEYAVMVTNNALDDAPVWEDCTAAVEAGANHVFANKTASKGFAFNFKVEAERGESGEGGYITSVQGGFR